MAISQPGTWNIGGFNLPDLGLTERLGIGGGNSNFQNPAVANSGALFQQPYANPAPSGQVQGASTQAPMLGPAYSGPQAPAAPSGGTQQPTQQASQPSGGGEPDINAQLDAIFNPVLSSLQGQESQLGQNYQNAQSDIQGQYGTSQASLSQQNKQGLSDISAQQTGAGTRKEDALTSATRLYNELNRGGQQRFGGASSAGEAYGALTAVEQQRRQATIQTAYDTAMQQIGTYKQNLNDKYTVALTDLETQKNSALRQAQSDFSSAMQQIQAVRNQVASDRATAAMNTLQDLRNKVYTINQQSLVFAQQLASNQQLSLKAVDDYTAKVNSAIGSTQVVNTNFGNYANTAANQTSYGIGQTNTQIPVVPQSGQIQSRPGQRWDEATQSWVPA